jgi:putative redox protein
MKANVKWNGNLSFTGMASSGIPIQMDADEAVGGNSSGVRPMEMIAMGLAACTAMDVLSILQKKRQYLSFFDVKFNAPRSPEYPKVFTSAVITFMVAGIGIEETALLRSIELSVTKYCPAFAMLEKAFPIQICYEIYEEGANGDRVLRYQGTWQETMQG